MHKISTIWRKLKNNSRFLYEICSNVDLINLICNEVEEKLESVERQVGLTRQVAHPISLSFFNQNDRKKFQVICSKLQLPITYTFGVLVNESVNLVKVNDFPGHSITLKIQVCNRDRNFFNLQTYWIAMAGKISAISVVQWQRWVTWRFHDPFDVTRTVCRGKIKSSPLNFLREY